MRPVFMSLVSRDPEDHIATIDRDLEEAEKIVADWTAPYSSVDLDSLGGFEYKVACIVRMGWVDERTLPILAGATSGAKGCHQAMPAAISTNKTAAMPVTHCLDGTILRF